jgi:predicted MPP superfamily phosphohydrolase
MRLLAPMLRRLGAPDGVLAVLGNHDYYFDASRVRQWLTQCGARVLVNEPHVIEREDAFLAVLGLDDLLEGQIDLAAAGRGVPDEAPRILISHNPDGVFRLDGKTPVAVMLSAHTHGGQIVLPWYGAPLRFCRVCGRHSARGWVPNAHAPLYVTSGVGGMIPFRINVKPEIVLVRLVGAPE